MIAGYFAGMRTGLYRHTKDGRQVTARRTVLPWVRRWYVVTPADAEAYERRVMLAHVLSMAAMILCVLLIGDRLMENPLWFVAVIVIAPLSSIFPWVTAELSPVPVAMTDLVPVDRTEAELRYARATGARTLWALLIIGVVLSAGQLFVLITDGVWWSWVGLAMFSLSTVHVGVLLRRLRLDGTSTRAP